MLNEAGLGDVVVFGGGIIPQADRPALHEAGVRGIFGPGTPTEEVLSFLEEVVERRANGSPCGVGEGGDWRRS